MKEQLKKADLFGLAIIAATLIVYFIRSAWTMYQTIAAIVGGLLVVISLTLRWPGIRAGLGRRSTKFGINSVTSVVLVLGILFFINYLGARYSKVVDMTTEKTFSLSDQSVQVAAQVKEDVVIKAFYPGPGEYEPDRDLLRLFAHQNSRISFQFIDPDKEKLMADQYQVTAYGELQNPMTGQSTKFGTLILEKGPKSERIEKQGGLKEEDITNALLKLVKGVQKTIYFTSGHGEKQIEATDPRGYQFAKKGLEKENYIVKSVNLIQEGKIPADATVVVIPGPSIEPLPAEQDMLDAYLNGGGSVLLLLDPPTSPVGSLADLLKKWSLEAGNNFVVDVSPIGKIYGAGPTMPLVTQYESHRITQGFSPMTFFPLARSITAAKVPVVGIVVEPIVKTDERSWAESDLTPGAKKVVFDEKVDAQGPIPIAQVATKTIGDKKSRLVVFGDSDFAVNQNFGQVGNGNLFTNAVTFLAQDESFISIKAKDPANRPVTMTESQQRSVAWLFVLLLPGSAIAIGISVLLKRRK